MSAKETINTRSSLRTHVALKLFMKKENELGLSGNLSQTKMGMGAVMLVLLFNGINALNAYNAALLAKFSTLALKNLTLQSPEKSYEMYEAVENATS